MKHQVSSYPDQPFACPDCDLLCSPADVEVGHYLVCPRCNRTLYKRKRNSLKKVLALGITGMLLYLPAISLPLITLESLGLSEHGNVLQSVLVLFQNDFYFVAAMVFISAVLFPAVLLGLIVTVALQLTLNKQSPLLAKLFSWYLHLQEWGMIEVYFLGIIISIIKIAGIASVNYNWGFFCFLALVLSSLGISSVLDKRLFWRMIENDQSRAATLSQLNLTGESTAMEAGLVGCHNCGKLSVLGQHSHCPRCYSTLHSRTPASLSKTWALVITSTIFFIPANLLPIMQVNFLGIPDRSTILDGIRYFFAHGEYPIGLIIFTASVLVPLFKVIGLTIMLFTVHSGKDSYLLQKAKMFRFIEFIGRWSMLDVFVVALLTVLVNFGFFTSIHIAPAATYFCVVVVSTMLAAISFDPRIMWDSCWKTTNGR